MKNIEMDKLLNLKKKIMYFDTCYRRGKPEITDYEFDKMLFLYKKAVKQYLNKNYFNDISVLKIPHFKKILNVESFYDLNDIYFFLKNIFRKHGKFFFVIQPKIDGIYVELEYYNGLLKNALTRGDGKKGQNIFNFCSLINEIPFVLPEKEFKNTIIISGELYMKKSIFNALVRKQEVANISSRNIVAGSVFLKEIKLFLKRKCNYIVHGFSVEKNEENCLNFLSSYFDVVNCLDVILFDENFSFEELEKKMEKIKQIKFDFDIDGYIFKINDFLLRKKIGCNSNNLSWIKAFKVCKESFSCIVKDIEWKMARNGRLIPVIIIQEKEIKKRHINRVSAFNFQKLKELNLCKKDIIEIEFKSEAVPILKTKIMSGSDIVFTVPVFCFYCNCELIRKKEESYCLNKECFGRKLVYLEYLVSRGVLNIQGLGKQYLRLAIKKGVYDLFSLLDTKLDFWLSLTGSIKLSSKIFFSIKKAQHNIDGKKLLLLLNIEGMGKNTVDKISKVFKTVEHFLSNLNNLEIVEGIGKSNAEFFQTILKEKTFFILKKIKEYNLNTKFM